VQPSSLNKIQRENRQPGTTAWQLTNPDDRQIEGYASLTSVPVGGKIDLFVNTKDASYTLTVFRLGRYGGKGGRKVLGPQPRPGVEQDIPTFNPQAPNVLRVSLDRVRKATLLSLFTIRAVLIWFSSNSHDLSRLQWVAGSRPLWRPITLWRPYYTLGPEDSYIPAKVSLNPPYSRGPDANDLYGVTRNVPNKFINPGGYNE
jgi:hypothetical protein